MGATTRGKYANGQEKKPWVDKEKIGLDKFAAEEQVEVIRTKAKVGYDGAPQDGRYYDGLVRNPDGTFTAIEVKSGGAYDAYFRPGSTQRQFDAQVNDGAVARGQLNGESIEISRVIVRREP